MSFLKSPGLFLSAQRKNSSHLLTKNTPTIISVKSSQLNGHLKREYFIHFKPTKTRNSKSSLKFYGIFLNKVANDETNLNIEIFN